MVDFLARCFAHSWGLWLDLAPYLLLGFALAGLLHGLLGEGLIRKHFATNRFSSVLKATLLGIPLPVCSCGVIPLAESLRRDGASKGATLAFLISTPTSGVDSIIATYGLMGPFFAIMRPLAGLLAGVGVGTVTRWLDHEAEQPPRNQPAVKERVPRRKWWATEWHNLIDYGLGQLPRDTGKWVILGTVAGGLVTALLPEGFVEAHLGNPLLQYLSVLLLSVPLYVCATGSIPLAMGLMAGGVLPGAALVLLIAGPATNTVTMTFIFKRMGLKVTLLYLGAIVMVALFLGVLTDWILGFSLGRDAMPHVHGHSEGVSMVTWGLALAALLLILWRILPVKRLFMAFGRRGQWGATLSIEVPDMTCQVCERKIRGHLQSLPGLDRVVVDLDQKRVRFDGEHQLETIRSELERLGYHPEKKG